MSKVVFQARAKKSACLILLISISIYVYTSSNNIKLEKLATKEPSKVLPRDAAIVKNVVPPRKRSFVPRPEFNCSVTWLRLPKTASTSVMKIFMWPLYQSGKFRLTEIGPNSCVMGVGGCATYWRKKRGEMGALPPPFGVSRDSVIDDEGRNATHPSRCYPYLTGPKISCHEYDARTSTMNFGPDRRNPALKQKKKDLRKYKNDPIMRQKVSMRKVHAVPPIVRANFTYGPALKTHVGLDASLFGWLLPAKTMVFSTFRDPQKRLLSSFHFGITIGGGRPGEVLNCELPGAPNRNIWQDRIVKIRERMTLNKDTTEYQSVLRKYLNSCSCAADNAYVQFLDPNTKDVSVALENLERYVIVGLQTDVTNSLKRWTNITLKSCRHHPRINEIRRTLLDGIEQHDGDKFRETVAELQSLEQKERLADEELGDLAIEEEEEEDFVDEEMVDLADEDRKMDEYGDSVGSQLSDTSSSISFDEPDIESFDEDLQELIRNFTSGDEVIFQRALELYEEQGRWGL